MAGKSKLKNLPINAAAVQDAAERIRPWVHRTPVLTSGTLDALAGARIFLKCENFQKVGAFKFRGAMNALLQLSPEERAAGVVTASSGNHAQALSLAGKLLGVKVWIVMPKTAPAVKRAATEGYGASIVFCDTTLASREATVDRLIAEHGYTLIHPSDDLRVIAGQGTAAWELIDQAGTLDLIISPVGGGGLLAGTALAAKGRLPESRVFGAEPAAADDAKRSLETGAIQPSIDPKTVADGLRTCLGPNTFTICRELVDGIVAVGEDEILNALRFVCERVKILIEPSAAVAVSPILSGKLAVAGLRVGIILSGGNVDLEPLVQGLKK
jgi:threo-3-hydroxy-L-aspartate ammonia-lyase